MRNNLFISAILVFLFWWVAISFAWLFGDRAEDWTVASWFSSISITWMSAIWGMAISSGIFITTRFFNKAQLVGTSNKGINVNLEVVNRYETNIMNTGIEGLAFLDEVNRPNTFIHLDTYHMNIEEDGMEKSVLAAGDKLGFVHIGESHRGYLGSGNVDFDTFFAALKKINYQGPITFESFSSAVVDPALSNTLCVWRNLWSDSDDLASTALSFMKARI